MNRKQGIGLPALAAGLIIAMLGSTGCTISLGRDCAPLPPPPPLEQEAAPAAAEPAQKAADPAPATAAAATPPAVAAPAAKPAPESSEVKDTGAAKAAPSATVVETKPAANSVPTESKPVAANDDGLRQFVDSWRSAWLNRDLDAYFNHYHPAFQGQAGSPTAWRDNRKQVIANAAKIQLDLGPLEIRREGEDRAWLTFDQRYKSGAYTDKGIKQLQLRRIAGQWLIEQEIFSPNR